MSHADEVRQAAAAAMAGDVTAEGRLAALRDAAAADGDTLAEAEAHRSLALLCASVGRRVDSYRHHHRAADLFERLGDRTTAADSRIGALVHDGRDPGQALDLLDRFDRLAPTLAPDDDRRALARLLRSGALVDLRRPSEALEVAAAEPPAAWRARYERTRGRALRDLGRLDDAEGALRRALEDGDPSEISSTSHTLALVLWRKGAVEEACAILSALSAGGREGAGLDLARLLRVTGRLAEARAVLDALPAGSDHLRARIASQRGLVAVAAGDRDEAAAHFQDVLRTAVPRGPDWNMAILWLAELADAADRPSDALALVLPLLESDPTSLVLAVSATASEPPGRCDDWIDRLAPSADAQTVAVLTRAVGRARAGGRHERAERLEALVPSGTG